MSIWHRFLLTFGMSLVSIINVVWATKLIIIVTTSLMVNLIWLWDDLLPQHLKHRRMCERLKNEDDRKKQ